MCYFLQVLSEGQLAEFDEPYLLLQDREGLFTKMIEQTGPGESQNLKHIAKSTFTKKHGKDVNLSEYLKRLNSGKNKGAGTGSS